MLSHEDNELITRVGPGTPMGNAMRRYWIPALPVVGDRRARLPAGARQAAGRGPRRVPRHRRPRSGCSTSTARTAGSRCIFGRNEECGLRCVYHGWKFDVDGNCVDMLNEPRGACSSSSKIHLTAYPTVRAGRRRLGLSRAGRARCRRCRNSPGPRCRQATATSRRSIQEMQLAAGARRAASTPRTRRSCTGCSTDNSTRGGFKPSNPFVRGKAPKLVVDVTDYGYLYAGIRPLGDGEVHIRSLSLHHAVPPDPPVALGDAGLPLRCRPHLGADG